MTTCSILDEITEKIGNRAFCTINDLIELGLFGSHNAALVAFRRGDIAYVRISPRRIVVAKQDLIKFIERNFKNIEERGQGNEQPKT